MTLDLNSLRHNLDLVESIEKATLRVVVQALVSSEPQLRRHCPRRAPDLVGHGGDP